jgi:hypothetical protein
VRPSILTFVLVAVVATGCRGAQRTFDLGEAAHEAPRSTSIFGEWVLGSPADSTAFAGASSVVLSLAPASFTITATYPGRDPLVITGAAALADRGLLTLTPSTGTASGAGRASLNLAPGQPITLLASAAGSTLVFAPPQSGTEPSSVWHRRSAVETGARTTPTP